MQRGALLALQQAENSSIWRHENRRRRSNLLKDRTRMTQIFHWIIFQIKKEHNINIFQYSLIIFAQSSSKE